MIDYYTIQNYFPVIDMHYVDLDFVVQDLNTAPTKVAGRYCMHSHQTRTYITLI
jgi:hypothetical protein